MASYYSQQNGALPNPPPKQFNVHFQPPIDASDTFSDVVFGDSSAMGCGWIAASSWDGNLRISMVQGQQLSPPKLVQHPGPVIGVAAVPGSRLVCTICSDGGVRAVDAGSGQMQQIGQCPQDCSPVALTIVTAPHGTYCAVATCGQKYQVLLFNITTPSGQPVIAFDSLLPITAIASALIVPQTVSAQQTQPICVLAWTTSRRVPILPDNSEVPDAARASKYKMVVGCRPELVLLDLTQGVNPYRSAPYMAGVLDDLHGQVTRMQFYPQLNHLVVTSMDGKIITVNVGSYIAEGRALIQENTIPQMKFSNTSVQRQKATKVLPLCENAGGTTEAPSAWGLALADMPILTAGTTKRSECVALVGLSTGNVVGVATSIGRNASSQPTRTCWALYPGSQFAVTAIAATTATNVVPQAPRNAIIAAIAMGNDFKQGPSGPQPAQLRLVLIDQSEITFQLMSHYRNGGNTTKPEDGIRYRVRFHMSGTLNSSKCKAQ